MLTDRAAANSDSHLTEFGEAKSVDLIPNGSNIPVTKENRLQYIHLVSHFKLTRQIKLQSEAFFEGLSQMIDPKWLRCVLVGCSSSSLPSRRP